MNKYRISFCFLSKLLCVFLFCFLSVGLQAQRAGKTKQVNGIVEASCGECKFGLKGNGCHLAVRINGKAYFVDSTTIDEHGDAHAKDGFCNAVRKAKVLGYIKNNRFVAKQFILQPVAHQ